MNPTLRALLRFWWLVLAGLILGVIAGFLTLQAKADKKYIATAQIFVNSHSDPYLRTSEVTVSRQSPPRAVRTRRGASSGSVSATQLIKSGPTIVSGAPNTETLVNAANLYPLLIQSDDVAELQGTHPPNCKLEATGVFASTNTFGVFKASPVPVVAIKSTCKDQANAIPNSQGRVEAFNTWIIMQQNKNKIPQAQRLLVQELTRPTGTKTIGGPSAGAPIFVGVVVFLIFCGIAILLDRPRPEKEDADDDERPAPTRQHPQPPPTPAS
jgi:hypothetical protein